MKKNKEEELRGGLATLLGGVKINRPKMEILETIYHGEDSNNQEQIEKTIDNIQDEELKNAIIENQQKPKRGRPRKTEDDSRYIRITTIVDSNKWDKIKQVAIDSGLTFKEVMDAVLDMAISTYEKKNGEIKTEKKQPKTDASSLFI